ncbi:MAG: hypothetical protein NZO16_05400 [Deltaproteobacteria bacterium]|nr:hypothetical protein [Deltaproteobacteria bacterium]
MSYIDVSNPSIQHTSFQTLKIEEVLHCGFPIAQMRLLCALDGSYKFLVVSSGSRLYLHDLLDNRVHSTDLGLNIQPIALRHDSESQRLLVLSRESKRYFLLTLKYPFEVVDSNCSLRNAFNSSDQSKVLIADFVGNWPLFLVSTPNGNLQALVYQVRDKEVETIWACDLTTLQKPKLNLNTIVTDQNEVFILGLEKVVYLKTTREGFKVGFIDVPPHIRPINHLCRHDDERLILVSNSQGRSQDNSFTPGSCRIFVEQSQSKQEFLQIELPKIDGLFGVRKIIPWTQEITLVLFENGHLVINYGLDRGMVSMHPLILQGLVRHIEYCPFGLEAFVLVDAGTSSSQVHSISLHQPS